MADFGFISSDKEKKKLFLYFIAYPPYGMLANFQLSIAHNLYRTYKDPSKGSRFASNRGFMLIKYGWRIEWDRD